MNHFSRALALSSLIFFTVPMMHAASADQQLVFSEAASAYQIIMFSAEEWQIITNAATQAAKEIIEADKANDCAALEKIKPEAQIPDSKFREILLKKRTERAAELSQFIYQYTKQALIEFYHVRHKPTFDGRPQLFYIFTDEQRPISERMKELWLSALIVEIFSMKEGIEYLQEFGILE